MLASRQLGSEMKQEAQPVKAQETQTNLIAFTSGEESYKQAFGKSEQEICSDWGEYIKQQD